MMSKIAHTFMNQLAQRLAAKDIHLEVTDAVYKEIATQGVDPVYGARPMKRYIQRNIETLIARKIVEGAVDKDETCVIDCVDGAYTITAKH